MATYVTKTHLENFTEKLLTNDKKIRDELKDEISNLPSGGGSGSSYTLPTASTTTLGGVKVDNDTITVDGEGVISSKQYTLPTASTTTLGGVKVDGTTVTIDSNGVISSTSTGNGKVFAGSPNDIIHFKVKFNTFSKTDINSTSLDAIDGYTESEDTGILFLPPNYSKTGSPVRLIIYCHGAADSVSESTTSRNQPCEDLVKLGYAVMDMNATGGAHYANNQAVQAYVKGYQYCVKNYNLYKEVFLSGLSMGGMMSLVLGQNKLIPTLAQGLFCPVTDHYRQAWCKPWAKWQRNVIAQTFDFKGYDTATFTQNCDPTSEEIKLYKDNIMKTMGSNPMTKNTNWFDIDLYQDASDLDTLYNKLVKYYDIPLKVWQCEDDGTVDPYYTKKFIEAIRRGGGIAYYRGFVSGGHKAWEAGNTTTIKDYAGNNVSVKSSCFELVNWFRRFEDNNGYSLGNQETENTYTITNTLTNVTTSNSATSIKEGEPYSATLTAKDGYVIETVTVTMGSEDITVNSYSSGSVTINTVTGNVVITANAKSSGSTVVTSDPQIFYDFTTGNANDLSGNSRNAVFSSGFEDSNNGIIGNEFVFNGDKVGGLEVEDTELFSRDNSIVVELVTKVKKTNISTMLLGFGDSKTNNEDTKLKMSTRNGNILAQTKNGTYNIWGTVSTSSKSLVEDEYTHVVYTYNISTHTKKIYVNGVLAGTSSEAEENKHMPTGKTFNKLYIGSPYEFGGSGLTMGSYAIKMIKYYDNTIFTDEEVTTLYNNSLSYLA